MTEREKGLLLGLAEEMDEAGFQSDGDSVREYVRDDGAGWRSVDEFLAALARDVWWHFGHVGEEDERHIYVEAERRIDRVREKLAEVGMRNPGVYYCVAWLPGGQLQRYESCTTNEERAYSHLNRLRKQGRTEVGMVELDHKPPGVKAPPRLRQPQQGTLFSTEPPPGGDDDPGGQMGFSFNPGLTAKQLEALEKLHREGPQTPWEFGSTTVNRLRKEGLVEDVVAYGAKHLQITEAGLDRLARGNPSENPYHEDRPGVNYWIVRKSDGAWLHGPYHSARAADRELLKLDKQEGRTSERQRIHGPYQVIDEAYLAPRSNPEKNPSDAPHRFRVRYTDKHDPGCPVFSQVVRAWDRESAEEAFWDAPDAEGWDIVSIKRLPKKRGNPPITAEERHDLPGADFAVPEHEGLPIDTPGRTRAAMARFNQFDFDSNAQKKAAYRRILARARRFGIDPAGFQARWHMLGR